MKECETIADVALIQCGPGGFFNSPRQVAGFFNAIGKRLSTVPIFAKMQGYPRCQGLWFSELSVIFSCAFYFGILNLVTAPNGTKMTIHYVQGSEPKEAKLKKIGDEIEEEIIPVRASISIRQTNAPAPVPSVRF